MERRLIDHKEFGLSVCWPKTHWSKVPEPGGSVMAEINGARMRLRIETEPCNCQGDSPHEHRFLALPKKVNLRAGDWVDVMIPE